MERNMEIIAAVVTFIGFGGLVAIAGWIWRLSADIQRLKSDATAASKEAALASRRGDEALALAVAVKDRLTTFEIDAARRFATIDVVEKVENRVVEEIHMLRDLVLKHMQSQASTPRARGTSEK